MPKTRDAFAFRDFDPERILQRRFFKDFHLYDDETDEEILKSLATEDFEEFTETMIKADCSSEYLYMLAKYQKHIMKHGDRLTKYARALEYKIATDETANIEVLRKRHKRVDELSMKYCGAVTAEGTTSYFLGGIAVDDVGGLCQKFAQIYKKLDGKIKSHYRKIFAERLKQARKELRLTQTEFARRLNTSQRAIGYYEKAACEPSIAMLVRISKILKRPIDWFLGAI